MKFSTPATAVVLLLLAFLLSSCSQSNQLSSSDLSSAEEKDPDEFFAEELHSFESEEFSMAADAMETCISHEELNEEMCDLNVDLLEATGDCDEAFDALEQEIATSDFGMNDDFMAIAFDLDIDTDVELEAEFSDLTSEEEAFDF